ncbi:MAG TPA: DinB family protein [Puia sp.]|jgi:hypothetical protein|nr:DinB family protein [Puia sp.]
MQSTIEHLEKIIRVYLRRMETLSDEAFEFRPRPDKWSRKEILGHLVDSAQNNIRRFIVAQYEDTPNIFYAQDEWVKCSGYREYPVKDLIALWSSLNQHLVIVLKQMGPDAAERLCSMGGAPQTLKWVAADYCNHLLHHLHQILDIEPLAYP